MPPMVYLVAALSAASGAIFGALLASVTIVSLHDEWGSDGSESDD